MRKKSTHNTHERRLRGGESNSSPCQKESSWIEMTRWQQQESDIDRFFSLFKCTRRFFFPPHSFYMKNYWEKWSLHRARPSILPLTLSHSNGSETMVGLPRTEKRVSHRQFSYMICELIPLWWVLSFWLEQKARSSIIRIHILKEKWNVKKFTTCKSYINVSYTPWVWAHGYS